MILLEGQDYNTASEKSTNVWSLPASESLVFADGSAGNVYSGSGFKVAKSVTFDRTSKVTRVSHELRADNSVSIQAKVEFTYEDNTEANSSLFRTSSPFTSYQVANHLNPFPGKAVEGFKIWLIVMNLLLQAIEHITSFRRLFLQNLYRMQKSLRIIYCRDLITILIKKLNYLNLFKFLKCLIN